MEEVAGLGDVVKITGVGILVDEETSEVYTGDKGRKEMIEEDKISAKLSKTPVHG